MLANNIVSRLKSENPESLSGNIIESLSFSGFLQEDFENIEEKHKWAGIAKKNGFNVVPVPKTVDDLFSMRRNSVERDYWSDDGKWNYHFFNGSVSITDVTNALLTGKTCTEYHLSWSGNLEREVEIQNTIGDMSMKDFLKALTNKDGIRKALEDKGVDGMAVYGNVTDRKSNRIFSPFAVSNLKRVTKLPPKPTISHVIKLLANGQFKELVQDYSYTDDYAFDAANDHGKKKSVDPTWLLQDMMMGSSYNRPYTRETSGGELIINFGPHSNKSYSMVVDLAGKMKVKI